MAKRNSLNTIHPPSRPPPTSAEDNPNLLLAALPTAAYQRLFPDLTSLYVTKIKVVLHTAGEPLTEVFFPGDGFVSEITTLEDGKMVEIATVGREGFVGLAANRPDQIAICSTMVQAEMAICFRMPTRAFRQEMGRHEAFYDLIIDYTIAHQGCIAQSAACNIAHSMDQRLARWLLAAQDRIGRDAFPMTQEFVAIMLGATRQSVAITAGLLQKAGFITYHRGHMLILERTQLEAAACECHKVTTALLNGVLARAHERNAEQAGRTS